MDSPVPASMFAPEPSSPGAARAAAAAARLHDGFDSDCSEDGEALNGEPELDLTNKVGPGAGIGAKWDQVPGGPGGGPSRFPGDSGGGDGRGRARPPAGGDSAGGSRAMGGPVRAPPPPSFSQRLRPPPAARLPGRSQPLGSATWNSGARHRQRPARCHLLRYRGGPAALSVAARVGGGLGAGVEAREDQVVRSEAGGGSSWCRERKQKVAAQSGRRMSELCPLCQSTQNNIERGT